MHGLIDAVIQFMGEALPELVGGLFGGKESRTTIEKSAWGCAVVLLLMLLGIVILAIVQR